MAGRPTLYKPEMDRVVLEYYEKSKKDKTMPFIEEIALELDIDIDTLEVWVNGKNPAVSDQFIGTIKKVRTLQRKMLMSMGLGSVLNTAMSIFLLKANHNLKETSRQEITGKDGQPIEGVVSSPEQLTSLLESIEKIADDIKGQDDVPEGTGK